MKHGLSRIRCFIWLILWSAAGIWVFLATRHADRIFLEYIEGGAPASGPATVCELLPSHVEAFVYNENFHENWKALRDSEFYSTLKGISGFREILNAWNLGDKELSSFEKWILQSWGPSLAIGYSREKETLYLLSPIGNREKCIEWLQQTSCSSFGAQMKWEPRQLQGHWRLESVGSPSLASQFNAQFYPIHGMAVLAISPKPDPLSEIFRVVDAPQNSLTHAAGFSSFFQEGLQHSRQVFGFLRPFADKKGFESLGFEWRVAVERDGKATAEIHAPVRSIVTASTDSPDAATLAHLRQPDDMISVLASWEDLQVIREKCLQHLPAAWTAPLRAMDPDSMLGSYRTIWDQVFSKLGHSIFVGLGEADIISEKYRIPFPRTVLAMPFDEPDVFKQALEATVLRLNREQKANLLIRKEVRSYGEYYEIRMENSVWRQQHGLKEIPAVAFAKDLLIISSDSSSMEKVLEHFATHDGEATGMSSDGVDFRISMRRASDTVRILLGVFGVLDPQGENVFLSPGMMRFLSEVRPVMEQFGDSHIVFTFKPGHIQLHGAFEP